MADGGDRSISLLHLLGRFTVWIGRGLFVVVFLIALTFAFGVSGGDYTRLHVFTDSVVRWQRNPDFRTVAREYVTQGSDAMRTEPFGVTAASGIVWLRSLSITPKGFELNEGSQLHYRNFSRGPLSAYLHLCSEQDLLNEQNVGGYLGEMKGFGDSGTPDDAKIHQWLAGLKWTYPVASDEGAVQSLRTLLVEIEPYKPFKVQVRHINDALRPHIVELAADLKLPSAEPEKMTFEQQLEVLNRLDAHIHYRDPELWRTKQVSDLVGGIWAQVFGPPYNILLIPILRIVEISRWVLVGMLALLVWRAVRRRRSAAVAELSEDTEMPQVPETATGTIPTPA